MKTKLEASVPSSDCSAAVQGVSHQLESCGYRPSTLGVYRWVWKKFLRFAAKEPFSRALAERFLQSQGLIAGALEGYGHDSRRPCLVAAMRALCRYVYGSPAPVKRPATSPRRLSDRQLSDDLEATLGRYQRHCTVQRRLGAGTVYARITRIRKFLEFVSDRVGPHLEDLRADHVSDFITAQRRMAPGTAAGLICLLRSFLSFLWTSEIVSKDLSQSLPKVRVPEHAHIPLVWAREQVDRLLSAIDRNTAKGKRDYAILLLACKLGLRSKDIRTLVLENLRWPEARIEITQSKNGRALTLPLLEDVGDALIDYLCNGRPNSPSREVFLGIYAPFKPITTASTLGDIMKYYLRRAGIPIPKHHPVGLHSLRHTLATRMLESNIPLPTISEVLGHRSTESTRIYTKVDIAALRSAGLDPDAMIFKEVRHA